MGVGVRTAVPTSASTRGATGLGLGEAWLWREAAAPMAAAAAGTTSAADWQRRRRRAPVAPTAAGGRNGMGPTLWTADGAEACSPSRTAVAGLWLVPGPWSLAGPGGHAYRPWSWCGSWPAPAPARGVRTPAVLCRWGDASAVASAPSCLGLSAMARAQGTRAHVERSRSSIGRSSSWFRLLQVGAS